MKEEATIAVDTGFIFEGHRVLLEVIPLENQAALKSKVERFEREFWGDRADWMLGPQIVDMGVLGENEKRLRDQNGGLLE